MLGYRQKSCYSTLFILVADESMGREHENVSPKEQVGNYESLRQKDSYRTQLWRELLRVATQDDSQFLVKLSGARTEKSFYKKGFLCFLLKTRRGLCVRIKTYAVI